MSDNGDHFTVGDALALFVALLFSEMGLAIILFLIVAVVSTR